MDLRIPRDGQNAPINRAMGVPVVQDSRVLISSSKYVDMIDLRLYQDRVFHGISVENPSATQRILIAIGKDFSNQKCISVAPSSFILFDQQTFGAIYESVQDVQQSTKVRAALSGSTGTAATGTLTFVANPSDQQNVVINGVTYEFMADQSPTPGNTGVVIAGTLAATLSNLVSAINQKDQALTASASATVLTLTSNLGGAEANAIALSAGTTGATASGATLTGATGGVTPIIHIW